MLCVLGVEQSRVLWARILNPNVADLCQGKTHQGAPDVASRRLGEVEAYLTVREILPETSKGADGVLWCELSGFGRQQVCNVRVYWLDSLNRLLI